MEVQILVLFVGLNVLALNSADNSWQELARKAE
jgi:hypothetical protein